MNKFRFDRMFTNVVNLASENGVADYSSLVFESFKIMDYYFDVDFNSETFEFETAVGTDMTEVTFRTEAHEAEFFLKYAHLLKDFSPIDQPRIS